MNNRGRALFSIFMRRGPFCRAMMEAENKRGQVNDKKYL
jgi:hypothetical protein